VSVTDIPVVPSIIGVKPSERNFERWIGFVFKLGESNLTVLIHDVIHQPLADSSENIGCRCVGIPVHFVFQLNEVRLKGAMNVLVPSDIAEPYLGHPLFFEFKMEGTVLPHIPQRSDADSFQVYIRIFAQHLFMGPIENVNPFLVLRIDLTVANTQTFIPFNTAHPDFSTYCPYGTCKTAETFVSNRLFNIADGASNSRRKAADSFKRLANSTCCESVEFFVMCAG
jgi:hypothetical protein